MNVLPSGKFEKEKAVVNQYSVKTNGEEHRSAALQIFTPYFSSALSPPLSDRCDRHSRNVRNTRRAVKVTAGFPLPKFLLLNATARNQQRPTATRGWSKLTPVRPLCAPDACGQENCARKLPLACEPGTRCGQCPPSRRESTSDLC